MLVLGIDPGLAVTGYGLIRIADEQPQLVEAGVIRSHDNDPIDRRVGSIYAAMTELLADARPDCLSMEDLYSHYNHPKTAVIMAHARGAILAAACQSRVPVTSYAATKIKSAITGNGRARKDQVQQMIMQILNLSEPLEPVDQSDALAAALCHAHYLERMTV